MRRFIVIAILALLPAIAIPVDACPNCKDSVATGASDASGMGDASGGLPGGFNASIYIMLTAFAGVLGFVGFTLYRGVRGPTRRGFDVAPSQPPR